MKKVLSITLSLIIIVTAVSYTHLWQTSVPSMLLHQECLHQFLFQAEKNYGLNPYLSLIHI